MKLFVAFGAFLILIIAVFGQDLTRFRSTTFTPRPRPPPRVPEGKYNPDSDGRYRPANDGRYVPANDGKYVHVGDGFRGLYSGDNGQYTGSGDQYSGQNSGQNDRNSGGNKAVINVTQKPIPTTTRTAAPVTTKATTPSSVKRTGSGTGEGGNGWKIIQLENKAETDGYHYLFETENGILGEERGRIETPELGLKSQGFYEYTGDDGVLYRVDYVADVNGFVPTGNHLPKLPKN